jgi:hypothetical protein
MSGRAVFCLAAMTMLLSALATRSAFGIDGDGAAARVAAIQATMARYGIALIKPPPLQGELDCLSPATAPAAASVLSALSFHQAIGP